MSTGTVRLSRIALGVLVTILSVFPLCQLDAQTVEPTLVDPHLGVRTVASGLTTPVGIAFIGRNDMLVLEKDTGMVKRITNGVLQADPVLDLAVNAASERGLLGIALHPRFPSNPGVYLYWTCRTPTRPVDPPADPFLPDQERCDPSPGLGEDSTNVLEVPLLGNRVDRFEWTESGLVFDRNLIMLRAFQNDAAPTPPGQDDEAQMAAGNHNGGVIRFGHDGKLYIIYGDNGRRGQLQNLETGPTPPSDDDQFGGPEPDDAHLTGVILRLNPDGSTPEDNPFFRVGKDIGGPVGVNIKKIFAYGIRNSFGMAVDPFSGDLWIQVNGDDTFDEIQRVKPGLNSGWVQIIGPVGRLPEFKNIETTLTPGTLQQFRWPPSNIADTPDEALQRLFMLPGAHYDDPQFSWRFAVAPGGIGFVRSLSLGRRYVGDLIVGASRTFLEGGYLFRFKLNAHRQLRFEDTRLADGVADNNAKFDLAESESLLFGRNFGIGTDIQTGPNGNLFVVSLSNGAIYEVFRARREQSETDDEQDDR